MLSTTFHDGTPETGLIEDGVNVPVSLRSWNLTERLTATQVNAMQAFFEGQLGGVTPFYWYNPFEPEPGQPIGSNYDPTGESSYGRYTVRFRGNWSETTSISLTDTPLEIAEVA
jgi:phage-related protein